MEWNPLGNDGVVICLDIIVMIIRLCIDIELISIYQDSLARAGGYPPPPSMQSIIFTLLIDDVFPSLLWLLFLS